MEAAEIIELTRAGIFTLLKIAAPLMLVALFVGLTIGLLQALTQIQEATLSFVPKILAMLLTLAIALPYMIDTLSDYSEKLYDKIVHVE